MPSILTKNYFNRGFWGDEAWTALISKFPLQDIVHITSQDFHPPFYYFLVHFWGKLFSFSETSLRSLSLLFFLLTIYLAYKLAQKLLKKPASRIAATFLVATSPILFTYAFEARAYALLSLLSTASALVFLNTLQAQKPSQKLKWQILYFLLGAIAVYTHYYAWFILASHGLYLLLFQPRKIKKLLIPALGILLVQLPWLPSLFSQINQVGESYWIAPMNYRTHWEFFYRTASGDTHTRFQIPLALAFISFITFTLLRSIYQAVKSGFSVFFSREKTTIFLFTWLLIPTLIPTLISLKLPIFFYRYLIFSSIPIIFLLVKSLSELSTKIAYTAKNSITLCVKAFGVFQAWILGNMPGVKNEKARWLRSLEAENVWFVNRRVVEIFILLLLTTPIIWIYLKTDLKIFQKYPQTFRQEKARLQEKLSSTKTLYTVLPSFAEVTYYFGQNYQIRVLPQGLVQFSGKSLLDAYVAKGKTKITQPLSDSYFLLKPGPQSFHITPQNQKLQPLF